MDENLAARPVRAHKRRFHFFEFQTIQMLLLNVWNESNTLTEQTRTDGIMAPSHYESGGKSRIPNTFFLSRIRFDWKRREIKFERFGCTLTAFHHLISPFKNWLKLEAELEEAILADHRLPAKR